MISYKSFNDSIDNFDKSTLETDRIDETLVKYPYFNVLKVLQSDARLLDYLASEKHSQSAMKSIYDLQPENSSVTYTYSTDKEEPRVPVDAVTVEAPKRPNSINTTIVSSEDMTSPVGTEHDEVSASPGTAENAENLYIMDTLAGETSQTSEDYAGIGISNPPEEVSVSSEPANIHIQNPTDDASMAEIDRPVSENMQLTQQLTFGSWLKMLKGKNPAEISDSEVVARVKAEWQKKKLQEVQEEESDVIDDEVFDKLISSVTESDELISEPLAELYLNQGYTDKAISVYQKLILKYPQKSGYFADQIRKIKK